MLDAGGGGGGGTPWALLTVDKMYELIKSADTDKQWTLADGWKKSAELISSHRFQVQDYRDNLASAWPPDRSQASAAYLDRLDVMIASLTETYEAALQNYDAVVSATGSIYQAQVQMEKIYQEYKNNETLLANFAAKQQEQQNNPTPTPSPSPSGGEQPPVATGRQEALRLQASSMLNGVSTDLAQAQARIARPAPYQKPGDLKGEQPTGDDGGYFPPPIPPITPNYGGSNSSGSGSTRPSTTFPAATSVPTPPATTQPGLILGGTTPQGLTPPTPINPALPTPAGPGVLPSPGALPPSNPLLPGGGQSVVPTTGPGSGRNLGTPRDGVVRPGARPDMLRPMPPGGVIGAAPAIGPVHPGAGRPGSTRVNPVGGVIGEGQGVGARPGNSAGGSLAAPHAGGAYGPGGRGNSGRREDADGSHWDPDNPWETAEGVAPVVMPPREQRVDPGPAIGLH
ncbi:flagellar export protein FliJ [Paractinoplanes rishiriensis]|uniref:PPE family domain-containing protein n=1 Tax=Paractinoplanes rishiriensis TaxID=1050105 RepID=A0A919K2M1_9ACTN|nr:flagellar export protein FliJ [Actinoplanes rishiriensis]GIE99103.1 hypothetical protein Ari01nite_65680 [Actinoplanes rishiriensis]